MWGYTVDGLLGHKQALAYLVLSCNRHISRVDIARDMFGRLALSGAPIY